MALYLITGGGGFIGSNIAHELVARGERVRVLDDFSTGRRENLEQITEKIELVEGSIGQRDVTFDAMTGVDCCLHQAALASVPRSIEDPPATCHANITGTVNVFTAARDRKITRIVFASSSSVYGNAEAMPARETLPLAPISPYAITKAADEMYARVFNDLFGMDIVGLRYFNVFGPRQDPQSQYAAVVPIFIQRMLAGVAPIVYGDGLQSRDFTYVSNVVDANLMASTAEGRIAGIYNVACGQTSTLLDVINGLNTIMGTSLDPIFEGPRRGDIRLSYADITAAQQAFGYVCNVSIEEGLRRTVDWYRRKSHFTPCASSGT